ncbi:MAG: MoaD/ThiS family protein [Desulfobacterales bacterium]|nr:MAG: MoaD/ThiS family protein [Desulfobacterales bacterium]
MKVHLWLWGYLRQYIPGNAVQEQSIQDVGEGTTIRGLLDRLTIPEWAVEEIYLNDVRVKDHEILKDGDYLRIYPRIFAGG